MLQPIDPSDYMLHPAGAARRAAAFRRLEELAALRRAADEDGDILAYQDLDTTMERLERALAEASDFQG